MEIYLRVILVILSCYRIAQLFTIDSGPFDIFQIGRNKLGRMAAGSLLAKNFAELVSCPYCLGVWISLGLTPAVIFPNLFFDAIILIWGVAGGQALLQGITDGRKG
jgi:hypothetical protein